MLSISLILLPCSFGGAVSQRAVLHLQQRADHCAEARASAVLVVGLLAVVFEGMEVSL